MIRITVNPKTAVVNTKKLISNSNEQTFYRSLLKSEPYLVKVGKSGSNLIKKLFEIEGIVEITIKPYEVIIQKAKLFNWHNELLPKIKEVFKKELNLFETNCRFHKWRFIEAKTKGGFYTSDETYLYRCTKCGKEKIKTFHDDGI